MSGIAIFLNEINESILFSKMYQNTLKLVVVLICVYFLIYGGLKPASKAVHREKSKESDPRVWQRLSVLGHSVVKYCLPKTLHSCFLHFMVNFNNAYMVYVLSHCITIFQLELGISPGGS